MASGLAALIVLIAASSAIMASDAYHQAGIDRRAAVAVEWEEASLVYDAGYVIMGSEPGIDLFFIFTNSYGYWVEVSASITETNVPGAYLLVPSAPVTPGGSIEISLLHELLAPGSYYVKYVFSISTFWWEQSLRGGGTIVVEGDEP
jgi:hypothetical protein